MRFVLTYDICAIVKENNSANFFFKFGAEFEKEIIIKVINNNKSNKHVDES